MTSTEKYTVKQQAIVPDEIHAIQKVIEQWTSDDALNLVITTGGTGFSPRDITPEVCSDFSTLNMNSTLYTNNKKFRL